jgi:hypothetical protein
MRRHVSSVTVLHADGLAPPRHRCQAADAPGPGERLLFAIDDTPTARYGPCVQGAGIHHNPSPGPAGEKFVYGHVWVTLAWLPRHALWHTLALPLRASLYVRAKGVPELVKRYPWEFRTKLELAAELARWLVVWVARGRNCFSQSARLVAQRWRAVGPSQPHTMPQTAITTISTRACLRFRVCRGSGSDWK